jgi:DNA-binding GntR family transcriptional regulator
VLDQGEVSGRIVSTSTVVVGRMLAEELGVEEGTCCAMVQHTASVGDTVFSATTSYLPPDVGARVAGVPFTGDFYSMLESAGLEVAGGGLTIDAVLADEHTAAQLGVPSGAPLVMFHRRLLAPDGTPLEIGFVRCRGDQLSLQINVPRVAKVACP